MFLAKRFVEGERVELELGDEPQSVFGKFLAVVVRGVVAGVAVDEPAIKFLRAEQTVQGGVAEHVFEDECIHGLWGAYVFLDHFAEELACGLQREFEALNDGVAEDFIVHTRGLRFGEGLEGAFQGQAATLEMVEIEFHGWRARWSRFLDPVKFRGF